MYEYSFGRQRIPIDPCDVLHLCSFVNPCMVLVLKPFDSLGFGFWKRAMEIALIGKNKLGFINEEWKKPSSDSIDLLTWGRCNSMVIC